MIGFYSFFFPLTLSSTKVTRPWQYWARSPRLEMEFVKQETAGLCLPDQTGQHQQDHQDHVGQEHPRHFRPDEGGGDEDGDGGCEVDGRAGGLGLLEC